MWEGYKKEGRTKKFLDYLASRGLNETPLHTSGHADHETLRRMVEVLKPKKIVPIHTFMGDFYDKVFINMNIMRVNDEDVVNIIL